MILKLSEIEGLMLEDKKGEGDSEDHPFEFGQTIGFNQALEQQSSRSIEVTLDREALAKVLSRNCVKGQIRHPKEYWLTKADAIIASKDIVRVGVVK